MGACPLVGCIHLMPSSALSASTTSYPCCVNVWLINCLTSFSPSTTSTLALDIPAVCLLQLRDCSYPAETQASLQSPRLNPPPNEGISVLPASRYRRFGSYAAAVHLDHGAMT